MKAHPEYSSTKAGDVHDEEASGRNKIPEALAAYYSSKTGATFIDTVVQANRAYHTGTKPMERLLVRSIFDSQRIGAPSWN